MNARADLPCALSIEALCLPVSITNRLRESGIATLDDLCAQRASDLVKLPRISAGSIRNVRDVLAFYGLDLAEAETSAPASPTRSKTGEGKWAAYCARVKRERDQRMAVQFHELAPLGLSVRVLRVLGSASIFRLDDLSNRSARDLWKLPGLGPLALLEIEVALHRAGRALREEETPA